MDDGDVDGWPVDAQGFRTWASVIMKEDFGGGTGAVLVKVCYRECGGRTVVPLGVFGSSDRLGALEGIGDRG